MKSLNYKNIVRSIFPDRLKIDYRDLGIAKNIIDNAYWDFVQSSDKEILYVVKLINDHVFRLNRKIDDNFINEINLLKEKLHNVKIFVFNLTVYDIFCVAERNEFEFGYLFSYCCDLESFRIKSNYKRKYKKASKYLQILNDKVQLSQIYSGLQLYYKMNFSFKNIAIIERKYSKIFLENQNTINLICYFQNQIVGIMIGFIFEDSAYMHIFYYDESYKNYYISDFMYQEFIRVSKQKCIHKVIWGDVAKNDSGLNEFKKHYSTEVAKKYYCIF